MARTDDAEWVAAYIAEKPLLAESVYLRPKFNDKGKEKEVADLLLVHRGNALVLQIKCQKTPETRIDDQLSRWIDKSAKSAYKQLRGALRTLSTRDYYCTHPALGRMDFNKNQLTAIHGIVIVEHRLRFLSLPQALPLETFGVPISYFTLSDFLIHISELRTFHNLREFLDARHSLEHFDLRLTGCGEALLGHYMLNNGSFPVGLTEEQRLSHIVEKRSDFEKFLLQKRLGDVECAELERAARSLRKRAAGYPPRSKDDKNYRVMQLALMDLTYAGRRLVGRKIKEACAELSAQATAGIVQMCSHAVIFDELIVLVIALKGLGPDQALSGNTHFINEVDKCVELNHDILSINVNIEKTSPKYVFYFLTRQDVRVKSLSSRDAFPAWITSTSDAKF
jgi:hypothetical protein